VEGGKSIHPSSPPRELLNAGRWRVKERKRKVALSKREKQELSRSAKHPS
jgi:hypothetical protein